MLAIEELEKLDELNEARVHSLAQKCVHFTKLERTERCIPG